MLKNLGLILVALIAALALTACGDDDDSGPDASMDAGADGDTDTDTDADGDSDSDSDDGNDVGDPCESSMGGFIAAPGTCAASADDCTAGIVEADMQGNCNEGLFCCVNSDACMSITMAMGVCQADSCGGLGIGYQMGCPDAGNCCVDMPPLDAGPDASYEDDECELSFDFMGYTTITIEGVCELESATCPAGTISGYEQANCADGLQCCVGDDQCETLGGGGAFGCEAAEEDCTGMASFHAGCPDNGWCCSTMFK